MKMDLEQLRTFIHVVEIGSIKKTSEQLFISESTVNSRMRVLEDELECRLIERSGRGVRLTTKGEMFFEYVKRTLELLDKGEQEIIRFKQFSHSFRIASVSVVATYLLPTIIESFKKENPKSIIHVKTSSTSEIIDLVMTGLTELGLVRGPLEHKGLETTTLYSDPFIPVMSTFHHWNEIDMVEPKDFISETILTSSRKSSMWQSITEWFKEHGVTPRVGMEVDHIETIKHMIYHGFGIAFVPSISVRKELEEGKLRQIPIQPPLGIYRDTLLIRHKSKPLSAEAECFWNFLINNHRYLDEVSDVGAVT